MKYQWILFDADETLFSFDSFTGLKAMLKRYDIAFDEQDYAEFQAVNQPLWVAYQNKEITAAELRQRRFAKLSAQIGKDAESLNQELMDEMAIISQPLPQVVETLNALHGKVKMAIITNGFDFMQAKRLQNTQTAHFFEFVVVSENVGVAKPDPLIFENAFQQMRERDKSQILMVGDTLTSDILGGNQVGIDTCWYNAHHKTNDTQIQPTFTIHSMTELVSLVEGN